MIARLRAYWNALLDWVADALLGPEDEGYPSEHGDGEPEPAHAEIDDRWPWGRGP